MPPSLTWFYPPQLAQGQTIFAYDYLFSRKLFILIWPGDRFILPQAEAIFVFYYEYWLISKKTIKSEKYFELAIINLSEMDGFLDEKYRLEAKKGSIFTS